MVRIAQVNVGYFRNVVVARRISASFHTIDVCLIIDVIVVFRPGNVYNNRLGADIGDKTCPNAAFAVPVGSDIKAFLFGVDRIVKPFFYSRNQFEGLSLLHAVFMVGGKFLNSGMRTLPVINFLPVAVDVKPAERRHFPPGLLGFVVGGAAGAGGKSQNT